MRNHHFQNFDYAMGCMDAGHSVAAGTSMRISQHYFEGSIIVIFQLKHGWTDPSHQIKPRLRQTLSFFIPRGRWLAQE
jgi:hypothetical protein